MAWNPDVYHKFSAERKQPFYDCLRLIEQRPAMEIIDLGCGTGELTYELAKAMPDPMRVVGIDSSEEMLIRSAGFQHQKLSFRKSTIEAELIKENKWDLVFSHAALQWIEGHEQLWPLITRCLKPGGQLLIQMPAQPRNITNLLLSDLARSARYANIFRDWNTQSAVLDAGRYAEILFRQGGEKIQVLEKIYPVVVKDVSGLFDWVSGTALMPYLDRLSGDDKTQFIADYKTALALKFPGEPVFYPFKRIIMSAIF